MTYRFAASTVALCLGLWIGLVPFSRPLPGGAPFSLEATPRIGCQTPVIGMVGHDQPAAEVFTVPRPQAGDPTATKKVDCTRHARFRVTIGTALVVVAIISWTTIRRRGSEASIEPSD